MTPARPFPLQGAPACGDAFPQAAPGVSPNPLRGHLSAPQPGVSVVPSDEAAASSLFETGPAVSTAAGPLFGWAEIERWRKAERRAVHGRGIGRAADRFAAVKECATEALRRGL